MKGIQWGFIIWVLEGCMSRKKHGDNPEMETRGRDYCLRAGRSKGKQLELPQS